MSFRLWLGFATLCLLSGSAWMLDWLAPGPMHGSLANMPVHRAAIAIVFGILALLRRERVASLGQIALFGGLAFGALDGAIQAGTLYSPGYMGVLVPMLVPVAVIFVAAQARNEFGSLDNPLQLMFPALVAVGGATLLLPLVVPPTPAGKIWLAVLMLCVVAAGYAAVRLHELLQGAPIPAAGALVFGASSLVQALYAAATWSTVCQLPCPLHLPEVAREALRAIVVDGPLLWLTVYLLREMRPISFSARLLAIPLVTIVGGWDLLALRPRIDLTQALGLALLAGGTLWLIRADSREMLPDSKN